MTYTIGDNATVQLFLKCDMMWIDGGNDREPDMVTDENGVFHYTWEYQCQKCSLSYKKEEIVYHTGGCEGDKIEIYTFYDNGKEIERITIEGKFTAHNSNNGVEWVMHGNSCRDGITVTRWCDCGYVETKIQYDHLVLTETFFAGGCGGEIVKYECVCGACLSLSDQLHCGIGGLFKRVEEVIDGVTYRYELHECQRCDLKYIIDNGANGTRRWRVYVGENLVKELTAKFGWDY